MKILQKNRYLKDKKQDGQNKRLKIKIFLCRKITPFVYI